MRLHVQKVLALQVGVASGISGPEPPRVDSHLGHRSLRVCGVELQRPLDILEVAAHPGHHHVAHAKFGSGVPRLEYPTGHAST